MTTPLFASRPDLKRPCVIRGAKLLDAQRWFGETADILIIEDRLQAAGPNLEAPPEALALDGSGLLVHPGFVNGHTHGHNALSKGTGDRWTLELLLAATPWNSGQRTMEDRYLSAAINAAEMALKGCTTAYDLFLELPGPTVEGIHEAIRAYQDVGIRVAIAPMLSDIGLYDAVPGLYDALPPDLQKQVAKEGPLPWQESFRVMEALAKNSHFDSEWVRIAIAPTIPMHCSAEFLTACRKLADETGLGIQSHVAESKVQLIGAEKRYGSSIVAYLKAFGIVRRNFTVAHGVWLSEEDMDILAAAGASVSVNAGSNMRLGNGLPDVRRMLQHGVNVAVGTDGSASSDNQNMYEATRLASYVSRVKGPDPSDWLTSQEAFLAATRGGSRALGFEDQLGRLEPGAKADLVFLDLQTVNWVPTNNPLNQLAYTEDGTSVKHVMTGGQFIVGDRRLLTVDLEALGRRINEAHDRLERVTAVSRDLYDQLEPYVASYCPGLASIPHPVKRYCAS
jgi:5-methylthioadenosine/S-adenosylhomocysteine deaminase